MELSLPTTSSSSRSQANLQACPFELSLGGGQPTPFMIFFSGARTQSVARRVHITVWIAGAAVCTQKKGGQEGVGCHRVTDPSPTAACSRAMFDSLGS